MTEIAASGLFLHVHQGRSPVLATDFPENTNAPHYRHEVGNAWVGTFRFWATKV